MCLIITMKVRSIIMAAKLRLKCPNCKKPINIHPTSTNCPECARPIVPSPDACIYLYRQGSPLGIAGGFGIYVNGEPYGYIGNKELLCLPLPYGTYTLHCAVGMNRACEDVTFVLTPQNRVVYSKVYMTPGFWSNKFHIVPVDPGLLDL